MAEPRSTPPDRPQDDDGTVEGPGSAPRSGLFARFPALGRLGLGGPIRRIPEVLQTAETDCGAACLTMVLAYHGKRLRLEEVRDLLGLGRDGIDALSLLRGARFNGLRARGVKIDEIDNLVYLPPGSILHWGFHHYVVFERLDGDGARIVDPAIGRMHIGRDELEKKFTGIALTFEPADDFEPSKSKPKGRWRHVREVLSHGRLLGRIITMSLVLRLLALATPVLTGLLVDRVVPRGDDHLLTVLAAGLVGLVVFDFLSALVRAHLMLQLRTHLDAKITLEFLEHMIALPYAFFHQRSAGDLMMRLNSNTTIREILTSSALTGLLDGVLVSLYLVLLFAAHAFLGTVVLLLGLMRLVLFLVTRRRHRDLMTQTLHTQALSRSYQVQMLAGIETLKSLGAEQRAVEQWSNLFVDELNVTLERGRLDALFDSLLQTMANASPFVVLILGASEVLAGRLSLGTMLAVNALAAGFLGPLSSLVATGVQLQLLGSYLDRIHDVLDAPREQDPETVVPAPPLSGRITLEHVSFRYSALRPMVVRDVSLEIEPGQFVALVGSSGAGKSTLAYLLLGLYPPTAGRVLYDGLDLARLDLRTVRRQLGIVLQQPYLFGDSIRNNIALGDEGQPLYRVAEAAQRAHVHELIRSLPLGYDTPVADGGSSLSGGQRQRLALARALVRQPTILLLDEATSHLDSVSERQVQEELERLDATRIVIAHRLSTVVSADVILVMEEGQIVQRGAHEELVTRAGPYRDLIRAQLRQQPEADDAAG